MVRGENTADLEIAVDSVKQGHRFRDCPTPAAVCVGSCICIVSCSRLRYAILGPFCCLSFGGPFCRFVLAEHGGLWKYSNICDIL